MSDRGRIRTINSPRRPRRRTASVSKMMNFAFELMDFVYNMMNFVSKMMKFADCVALQAKRAKFKGTNA